MPYVFQDLGADIAIQGDDGALRIAQLQVAINRVIRGGRTDNTVTSDGVPLIQSLAKAATPVAISGVPGRFTLAAFKIATQIAGIETLGDRVDPALIAQLEAFADARGYPPDEGTPKLAPPASVLDQKFGAGLPFLPEAGVSLPVLLIGAAVLGGGFYLYKRGR